MITIHHLQRSQSERIPWLCEELGIPYALKLYQRSPLLSPPELQALTPLGAAPVIEDDSVTPKLKLAESAAIVEYLIHRHGQHRLALDPSHPNYADYLYYFHFANGNLQPCVTQSMYFRLLKLDADHPARRNVDDRLYRAVQLLDDRLRQVDVPWLAGQEFTAADIMTVFSLTTMRLFFPFDLAPYRGVLGWLERVGQREAYRVAMAKSDPGFSPLLGAEAPEPFPGLFDR